MATAWSSASTAGATPKIRLNSQPQVGLFRRNRKNRTQDRRRHRHSRVELRPCQARRANFAVQSKGSSRPHNGRNQHHHPQARVANGETSTREWWGFQATRVVQEATLYRKVRRISLRHNIRVAGAKRLLGNPSKDSLDRPFHHGNAVIAMN